MKVFLNIDKSFAETKVTIESPELDDDVQGLLNFIKERETEFLIGKKGEMQHILQPAEIHYFHTENERVIAVTRRRQLYFKRKII